MAAGVNNPVNKANNYPQCKTCRFWKETDWAVAQFHPDLAKRIREVETTTRECSNPKFLGDCDCNGKLVDPSTATPTASDNIGIRFETGAEFGCIHHEPL